MTWRVAVIAILSIATLILGYFWWRSRTCADRLHGKIPGTDCFILASKQSTLTFFVFRQHGHPEWWQWETLSYPVDDELSFPSGDPSRSGRFGGVAIIGDQHYAVMRSIQQSPDGQQIIMFGAASAWLHGSGITLHYWLLLLLTALPIPFLIIKPTWRFSLRTLMVVVTVVALGLGFFVAWNK